MTSQITMRWMQPGWRQTEMPGQARCWRRLLSLRGEHRCSPASIPWFHRPPPSSRVRCRRISLSWSQVYQAAHPQFQLATQGCNCKKETLINWRAWKKNIPIIFNLRATEGHLDLHSWLGPDLVPALCCGVLIVVKISNIGALKFC